MTLGRNLVLVFLFFFGSYTANYAQKRPSKIGHNKRSLHDVAFTHKQIYGMSCIPMAVEMVLKYNNRVGLNYYGLQNSWKNKADGTFGNFDGKVIRGLKFRHQFNIKRSDNFPVDQLFKTIDSELAAGRKVIVSLSSGFNLWHMYVIDTKMKQGDYVAYSRFFNDRKLITKEYVKRAIREFQGTDILTYSMVN